MATTIDRERIEATHAVWSRVRVAAESGGAAGLAGLLAGGYAPAPGRAWASSSAARTPPR